MRFDAVIIGASSAGLYAAELLAKGGARVGVFERCPELRPARRTLIVTPEFEKVLGPAPDRVCLHRTTTMALATLRRTVALTLDQADLIVERRALAKWLAERAEEAGARLFFSHRFRSWEPARDGLELIFDPGGRSSRIVADAIVGADGILSDVARFAGLPHPPIEPLVQAEVRLPRCWDPELTGVWFEPRRTRYFYWLIPESESRAVVGLIGDGRRKAGSLLRDFLDELGLKPLCYQGARVAMHHPALRPWVCPEGLPVYLVGDAAGQVKVTTVGGSVTGFAGARAAAEALLQGTPYAKTLRSLKRELDLQWGIRLLLNQMDNQGYDRLLGVLNPRLERFLSLHNRDRMVPFFWRLLLEPGLLQLGLYALMRLAGSPLHRGSRAPQPYARGDAR